MRGSAKLKIITHDLEPERQINPFSLWTGPSSPPFHQPQINSLASSPSTASEFEFEFDSIASVEIKDDPPVSPKLIPSFATGYWGAATVSSSDSLPPPDMKQKIAPLSHPITSPKQPSALPSPSVRQLMAEEIYGEQDDDFSLDFYSAPQTPTPTLPRKSAPAADREQWPLNKDEPSLSIVTRVGQRKSNSAALDRNGAHDDSVAPPVTQKNQLLQSSKSESNSHFALWTSSFAWEKSEEEKKKQGSKSGMKWAFKDLLRRTVPSSKAEAHYITKTMGASSSKKCLLSSSKTNPNIVSPLASTSLSTPHASTRPSTPGRSPTHSSPTSARSSPRHPSTPGRTPTAQTLNGTPMPSPPRSPLSPHAIHYQQNKAQSLELTRKTFLPYRQSLLGCLGGPGAFPPEQQAW